MHRTFALMALCLVGSACNASQSGPEACISAGGQCFLGSAMSMCAKLGPLGCNTDPANPGGGFCCLELLDAGDAGDAAAAMTDSAPNEGGK